MERIVQWYPGHMARAMRRIGEYLAAIDIVIEVADARVPYSGRNPALDDLIGKRARLLVLDREDLADPSVTKLWISHFALRGLEAIAVDGRSQRSVARVATATMRLAKERSGISRGIVLGLPNSGKSSIINGLLRRAAAKTENRAGVTRALQWFRLQPNFELMDTPGVLVPKIAGEAAQWKLAACGAVPRDRYDAQEVASAFHRWLVDRRPRTRVPDLEAFAAARGFARRGGAIDYHNAAQSYLKALDGGIFGRITFETPDEHGSGA
jgi:ribosome biogenesis GTPase A